MSDFSVLIATDFFYTLLAFITALVAYAVALVLYTFVTKHDEIKLIRSDNRAASVSFSATALAFALVLAAAVHNTQDIVEIALWGANALLFQLGAYLVFVRLLPDFSNSVTEDRVISVLPLAALQLAVAILNAAVFGS